MNQELSTTEAKIEQAAKKNCVCEHDCSHKSSFTAGASFATTDPSIIQAILQPFLEWVDTNYCNHGVTENKWSGRKLKQWLKEKNISREELIQKYFADNKQKENEQP